MKIVKSGFLVGCVLLILACGQSNSTNSVSTADTMNVVAADTATEKTFAVSLVNNKKDPTCGMPVTAGIHDTTHYENKVLGFCSVECKNEFLKNPKANLAASEIK